MGQIFLRILFAWEIRSYLNDIKGPDLIEPAADMGFGDMAMILSTPCASNAYLIVETR